MSESQIARRINRGGGHSYTLDNEKIDGATSVLRGGYPKPAFVTAAVNKTVDEARDRWDELVDLPPSERYRILEKAQWEHRDAAAERGKAAHKLIQELSRGAEVEPTDELAGYVDAYLKFVDEWQPEEILVEAPIFSIEFRYAGTLDVIAKLADGLIWLLDWKTGKGIYPDVALQLAAYRYADFYLDEQGVLRPMVKVDRCGSVWIQDGFYELRPVDAGPDAFVAFGHAQGVAAWRALNDDYRNPSDVIGAALLPPSNGGAPA